MAASLVLIAWGVWSIWWAPVLAARYWRGCLRSEPPDWPDLEWNTMAPWEWRVLGVAWLLLGGWGVFQEL